MTAEELIALAHQRRAVKGFHAGRSKKPMPAAFIASMQFNIVMRLLPRLTPYVKPHKWREPCALLTWRIPRPPFPKQFDTVSYRNGYGGHNNATVYANLGDVLYCSFGSGTGFIDADRVCEILYEAP